MKNKAMEVVEIQDRIYANGTTHQSEWLQATLSGVDEKMKAILNLLEDGLAPQQNSQLHETTKDTVKNMVRDLTLSYCSLAKKYEQLKSVSEDALITTSPSPTNSQTFQLNTKQDKVLSGNLSDPQLEVIYTNSKPTVEDIDIECFEIIRGFERQKTYVNELASIDEDKTVQESGWMDMEKLKLLNLVEENARLQVELIRRNTEKREIIRKLQNQVSRLESQNNARLHFLRYKQPVEFDSPRNKTILGHKLTKGCSKIKSLCWMKNCCLFPFPYSTKRTGALMMNQ